MSRTRQTATGLLLACSILSGWLFLHVVGVWAFPLARAAESPGWALAAVALVLVQSWLGAGMFIVAHDAMHGSLAPGRPRLNTAIGQLALGLYAGFPYASLATKHHAHHRRPGTAHDPDFHAGAPRAFWRWYVKFFREYWGWPQQAAITLVMVIYLLNGAPPLNTAVFWGLPAIGSSLQLFVFGTWLPHRHARDAGEGAFADRHNARTQDWPEWLTLLTCFHFGLHLEHHHSPGTPWWRLPAYRRDAQRAAGAQAAGFIAR